MICFSKLPAGICTVSFTSRVLQVFKLKTFSIRLLFHVFKWTWPRMLNCQWLTCEQILYSVVTGPENPKHGWKITWFLFTTKTTTEKETSHIKKQIQQGNKWRQKAKTTCTLEISEGLVTSPWCVSVLFQNHARVEIKDDVDPPNNPWIMISAWRHAVNRCNKNSKMLVTIISNVT